MHENHIDQLSRPQARGSQCETVLKKHEDKEQSKTQHEMLCSKNHKATQNKNYIRTTALERSVVSTTGGLKHFYC